MSLTESKIRHAHALEQNYFLSDDDGLSLKIEINGKKSWSYRFTNHKTKQRRRVKLGDYPELSLSKARKVRDNFKENDFTFEKDVILDQKTFKQVSLEWLNFKKQKASNDSPRAGVLQLAEKCLENDIYPILQDMSFEKVKRYDLVSVIRAIEEREVKEPVKKACSYLSQIYDFAVAMGYCDFNLATGLNKITVHNKIKKHYAYLKGEEIAQFLKRIQSLQCDPIIKKAILFKLYTGVRGAELLLAEPHHFDLKNKIWKIPALHIKQYRRKVIMGHNIPDFLVPLSEDSFEILQSALEWARGEKYVFYSPRNPNKPLHFNTINYAIRKMGYEKKQLTAHGLRSTFSTVLNESGLFQDNWIEAQLSHVDKNRTRASYNHAGYLEQRIQMMQWWGNYLTSKRDI